MPLFKHPRYEALHGVEGEGGESAQEQHRDARICAEGGGVALVLPVQGKADAEFDFERQQKELEVTPREVLEGDEVPNELVCLMGATEQHVEELEGGEDEAECGGGACAGCYKNTAQEDAAHRLRASGRLECSAIR